MPRRTPQVAILSTALLFAANTAIAQSPGYVPDDIGATHAPRAIAVADVSGDGWPDLILGGTNPPTIQVMLSHGIEDGDDPHHFFALAPIPVGGGPFDLAVGDLNRDGRPDVAVANADANAITVLMGIGRGDFAAPINIPFGGNPRGVAIGDFNRDGIPDIVATKFAESTVEVLYGAGDGTFPRRLVLQAPAASQGVAVGDFDNDGWTDFAVAATSGTVRVYKMFATGAVVMDLNPSGVGWNVLAVADFDRDGRQDIAVASTGSSIVQVLSNRASGWTASPQILVAASPRGITTGDLYHDGRVEIVTAGRASSTLSVVTRADNGTWTATGFAAGTGARTVAVGDFDRDGRLGIATANEFADSVSVFRRNTANPAAASAFERINLPQTSDNSVFGVGDFNHNGKLDIVQENYVLLDATTPSRTLGPVLSFSSGGAVGDFNRDGNLDVAYTFPNTVEVFFGDGAGGFTDGPATTFGAGFGTELRQADLNRDGRADLVLVWFAQGRGSEVDFLLGRDDGTFTVSSRIAGTWRTIRVADLDRDGVPDVVASSPSGVAIFLGDGTGGVKATKKYGEGTARFGFDLGDVNEDGILDLVVADGQVQSFGITEGPKLTVARGLGDGTFETIAQYDTTDPSGNFRVLYGLNLGDVNGDGHVDIFTSHADLLLGSGGGDFAPPQRFVGESVHNTMLADINGDGLVDALGYTIFGFDFSQVIMLNTLNHANRPPTGLVLPDRMEWPYDRTWWDTDENEFDLPVVTDPDMHALQYRWTLADGRVVSKSSFWAPAGLFPGQYQVTVTADDERGAIISDTFTLDIPPFKETVLLPANSFGEFHGAWQRVEDPTASGGARMWHPDAGAPKLTTALANPTDYFDLGFVADPTQEYKLWIRMKADGDHWANDSVFVQFTGAKDAAGNPLYEIGTTSALAVNLEECSGCGESGWGWEDDGWGAVNRNGVTLRFPEGGVQTIRIQTREDGVSIDQIVLSSEKYKTTRPGAAKNDTVKLDQAGPEVGPRR